jgi:hypothetical protein
MFLLGSGTRGRERKSQGKVNFSMDGQEKTDSCDLGFSYRCKSMFNMAPEQNSKGKLDKVS